MPRKKKKTYKFLTEQEIKDKIKNLHLTQRGEKDLDSSFNGCYLGNWYKEDNGKVVGEFKIDKNIFKGIDLSGADFSNTDIHYLSFNDCDLSGVDFKGAKFNANFNNLTNFEGADFRGKDTEYNIQDFSEKQRKQIIFTDEDYEKYQKKLEKENKKLKEITENTKDEQTDKLTESFEKLEKKFGIEEIRWLIISFIAFISLSFFFTIPILDIFMYEYTYKIIFWGIIVIIGLIFTVTSIISDNNSIKDEGGFWKEIWNFIKKGYPILIYIFLVIFLLNNYLDTLSRPEKSIFNMDKNYALIPFGILLSTFLYFSIYQYSKSKKLRIENQNKIALLHGLIALRTDTGNDFDKSRFYNNIANVVFDKVYNDKENNLPIDKIIDLVKIIEKK